MRCLACDEKETASQMKLVIKDKDFHKKELVYSLHHNLIQQHEMNIILCVPKEGNRNYCLLYAML